MKGVRFDLLREEDVAAVHEIEVESHSAPWSQASFVREIDKTDGVFIVAKSGQAVVGFGAAWVIVDECHVINMAVRAEHRRQGLGSKILGELVQRCVDRGATSATLEVRKSNVAAKSLYEKHGFVAVCERKRYYPDNKEDAIVMWRYKLGDNGP